MFACEMSFARGRNTRTNEEEEKPFFFFTTTTLSDTARRFRRTFPERRPRCACSRARSPCRPARRIGTPRRRQLRIRSFRSRTVFPDGGRYEKKDVHTAKQRERDHCRVRIIIARAHTHTQRAFTRRVREWTYHFLSHSLSHTHTHLPRVDTPRGDEVVRSEFVQLRSVDARVRIARVVEEPRGQIHAHVNVPVDLYRVRGAPIPIPATREEAGGDYDGGSRGVRARREDSPLTTAVVAHHPLQLEVSPASARGVRE